MRLLTAALLWLFLATTVHTAPSLAESRPKIGNWTVLNFASPLTHLESSGGGVTSENELSDSAGGHARATLMIMCEENGDGNDAIFQRLFWR